MRQLTWFISGFLGVLAAFGIILLVLPLLFRPPEPTPPTAMPRAEKTSAASIGDHSPTPTAVPTDLAVPPLAPGEAVQWDGLALTVTSAKSTHSCPDGSAGTGRPAAGAKFVIVQMAIRNIGQDVVYEPFSFTVLLNNYQQYGAGNCLYNDQAFGNACWTAHALVQGMTKGELFPGAGCQGWVLFEVPEGLAMRDQTVQVRVEDAGKVGVAKWRLE